MANEQGLTYYDNGWWTCGCGGQRKVQVVPPFNSVTIYVKANEKIFGPVTGIEYAFLPHQNSIDVDKADAEVWLGSGKAMARREGYKGRTTRTGVINGAKK